MIYLLGKSSEKKFEPHTFNDIKQIKNDLMLDHIDDFEKFKENFQHNKNMYCFIELRWFVDTDTDNLDNQSILHWTLNKEDTKKLYYKKVV